MAEASYKRIRRGLTVFMLVLSAVLLIQFLLTAFVFPRLKLGQIILESSLDLPDEDLLAMGGISGTENYLKLDIAEIQSRFEASPYIRRAYIEKKFPNTLKIVLYGRSPIGILQDEAHQPSAYFDEYGVVYNPRSEFLYRDLPLLSGVDAEENRLPDSLQPLLKNLKQLQSQEPLLFSQISEIRIVKNEGSLIDFKLFMNAYKLPVVLSSGPTPGVMKKILLVLDSLVKGNMIGQLDYADFRTEQVVLKTKEGR